MPSCLANNHLNKNAILPSSPSGYGAGFSPSDPDPNSKIHDPSDHLFGCEQTHKALRTLPSLLQPQLACFHLTLLATPFAKPLTRTRPTENLSAMDQSCRSLNSLDSIPAEIRLKIYSHYFSTPGGCLPSCREES